MASFLYIHIPFCRKKCIYCDFYSLPEGEMLIDSYINALCRELELRKEHIGVLKGVYIGGGTPSILQDKDIAAIMNKITGDCRLSPDAEITCEANPGTLTENGVKGMLDAGINRLSIGIQSLNNRELSLLGRIHDEAGAVDAFYIARKGGFSNISADLIYGIPGQDIDAWKDTLQKILSLHPEHISAYELTPEKNTLLFEMLQRGRMQLPEEDVTAEMYYCAMDMLNQQGYAHYEISNYALPGRECRHNLNYWNRGDYLGIGAGAHSFLKGTRLSNQADVESYINHLESGVLPVFEESVLSIKDEREETLFLGLRKTEGVDLDVIGGGAIQKMREALNELSDQGLLELSGSRIRLTRKGFLVCNAVIVRLMLCIEQNRCA